MPQKFFIAVFFLLITLSVAVWLPFSPIWSSSEAREAHVSSIMLTTGDFILPSRSGLVPSKPPLFHWITTGLAYVAGEREWVPPFFPRLTSTLSGVALLVIVYFTMLRLTSRQHSTALVAVLLLLGTYGFSSMMSAAMVDMVYALFVGAAFCIMVYATADDLNSESSHSFEKRYTRFYRILFFTTLGCAVLAKGPLGAALPALCGVVFLSGFYKLSELVKVILKPDYSWLIFILIAGSWYYLAYLKGGEDFIIRQLIFENVDRFTGAPGNEILPIKPWYYYLIQFFKFGAPLSILLALYCKSTFKNQFSKYVIFAACSGVFLLSCAAGKRHTYLLPLYPLFAMGLAAVLAPLLSQLSLERMRKFSRVAFIVSFGLSILGIILIWNTPILDKEVVCGLFIAVTILSLFLHSKAPTPQYRAISALIFLFSMANAVGMYVGVFRASLKNFHEVTQSIASHVPQDAPLYILREKRDEFFDPILYYLKRPTSIILPEDPIPETGYYLESKNYKIQPRLQTDTLILSTQLTGSKKNIGRDRQREIFLWQK